MEKMRKRLLAWAMAVVMGLTVMPVSAFAVGDVVNVVVEVNTGDPEQDEKFEQILNMQNSAPDGFDQNSTENPYGQDKGQPFLLSESNELLMYHRVGLQGARDYNEQTTRFEEWQNQEDASSIYDGFHYSKQDLNFTGDKTYRVIQAVAFDPDGSGRRDHVAFVGVAGNMDGDLATYLWIYDGDDGYKTRVEVSTIKLPHIDNNDQIGSHQISNYVGVTAGKYDPESKGDTIVVYAARGDSFMPYLNTYQYNEETGVIQITSDNIFDHGEYPDDFGWAEPSSGNLGLKQGVAMETGDFNGDGVDDLAVLTYFNAKTKQNDTQESFDFYSPQLTLLYGSAGKNILRPNNKTQVYLKNVGSRDQNGIAKVQTLVAPGIAAGDIDADGKDEIVVTGIQNELTSEANTNTAKRNNAYTITDTTTVAFVCSGDRADSAPVIQYNEVSTNNWTHYGFLENESCWQQMGVECVAINGHANAEFVFISGTLYQYTGSEFDALLTPEFFSKDYKNSDYARYFSSIAVGNFDENEVGREQLTFIIGEKKNDFGGTVYYKFGALGGKDYDKDNVFTGENGAAGGYYCTPINTMVEPGDTGQEDLFSDMSGAVLVPIDDDNDGTMVRYKGKTYVYSDPQVIAVLQMAPYFDEIDIGNDAGQTTYSFTTGYEYTTGTGTETSYGIGASMSVEGGGVNLSVEAGYAHDWSEEFENTLTTSTTDSFTAKAYDSVVVYRTPVFIYEYELFDNVNGEWLGDDHTLAISVPRTPAYVQMSVDNYNAFVDVYNEMAGEALEEQGKDPENFTHMKKLTKEDAPYLFDNEGNPWAYGDTYFERFSESNYNLGYNGGETSSASEKGSANTHTVSEGNGFSFEMSLEFGYTGAFVTTTAGINMSLDYMATSSSSTTTSTSVETSGTVQDLDSKYLLEEYGIPEYITQSYGFTWNLGTRKVQLIGTDETYVIGYNVSEITAPPPPVSDLRITNVTTTPDGLSDVTLEWSKPEAEGRIQPVNYAVYKRTDDGEWEKWIPATGGETTGTIENLESNTEYGFVVQVMGRDKNYAEYYSVWSNEATLTTPKANKKVNFVYDENQATVTAHHLGNLEIQDGDTIPEESLIYVEALAKPGYTITGVTLQQGDGEAQGVSLMGGKFTFVIEENAVIKVTTRKTVDSSHVSYGAESKEGETVTGTVSAQTESGNAIDSAGAKVYGPVTFTATPAEGYALKEWKVTTAAGEDVIPAAGSTWVFYPYEASHAIAAVFVPVDDPAVSRTITVNAPIGGGSIEITDAGGAVLTPDEDGKIQVPRGTELTITAVPESQYYTFLGWTDDFAEYEKQPNVTLLMPEDDLTIGAQFRADLLYQVTFGSKSVENGGGTVTASVNGAPIHSGDEFAPETKVDFAAEAEEGSRILKWAVTEGTITTFVPAESYAQQLVTKDKYTIESLGAKSDVDAYFKAIEKYDLTIPAAVENGTITVKKADGTKVTPGTDAIAFGDVLTITATPDDGYRLDSLTVNGEPFTSGDTITAAFRVRPSGGGGGGGGGGSVPTEPDNPSSGDGYPADVPENIPGGSLIVNPDPAKEGETVTITPKPEDGQMLDSITVTGPNGEAIELEEQEDGSFSYIQPAGSVSIAAVFTCDQGEGCPSRSFADIDPDAWYHDAVDYAVKHGLMNGTGADAFSPNGITTRAQIVTILHRLEKEPAVSGGVFTDVEEDTWYTDAVAWAAENGIVDGYGGGRFGPNDAITREQFAAILYRYAQYKGYDVSIGENTNILSYADFDQLAAWAIPAMQWACGTGIISGMDESHLAPLSTAVRVQAAAMLQRFCEYYSL